LTASARLLARQSSFVQARARFEQALERAEAAGDRAGVLDAQIGLGAVLWELGAYDEAQATLEAAVQRCRAADRPLELSRALGNLALVHQYQGKVAAARARYAESIALTRQLGDEATTATTLFNLAQMAEQTGDYLDARLRYDEVLAIRRQHNDRPRMADTLINCGNLLLRLGDSDGALAAFGEAEQIYRAANSWGDLGYIASGRAQIAAYAERYAEARRHYHDALGLFRMVGNQRMVGWVLAPIGSLAAREGRLAEAAVLFADAAMIHSGMGNLRGEIAILEGVASELALAAGQPALAARLLGAAAAAHRLHRQPPSPQEGRGIALLRRRAEAQLGDPGFARAWAEGEALSLEQAMRVAREALAPLAFEPSPAALRVFALGPLRVYRGETLLTAADWKYTKASELVLFLLLHPGATREQIGLALWPDVSPSQLRQRLSVALAHARRALGREQAWITLSEGRYRVADERWFDVELFTVRLREARQRLARDGSDERGAQLLAEAIALYQHEPAGAVADEGWLEPHRVELRAAYLDGLLSLAQLHAEQGRDAEAARLFERALAHEPPCEEAALGAMEAYQGLGDARRALACYSTLLAALAELDAAPGAPVQALAERLRSGDSAARAVNAAPARHH
jgi:DNA-binding SARP family transcriptional activator